MARRTYSREFKVSAVRNGSRTKHTAPEAAKSLGVDAASIRYWLKKFSVEAGSGTGSQGALAGRGATAAGGGASGS